jgi:hypothetical protein
MHFPALGGNMTRTTVGALLVFISPGFAADDVLLRHMDTVLDFVGTMTANCVTHYEEGMTAKLRAGLNFSKAEIGAYCVCSTKLLIGEMRESDFQNLAVGGDLPMKFSPIIRKARFDCAKKVWDARQRR